MYENRSRPLLTRREFALRLSRHALVSVMLLVFSLLVGMYGYMYFEHLAWRDAFLNSAMLLGGMGPVNAPQSGGGKIFAGVYALYAGLVFVAATGVLFAPVVHRMLHKLHRAELGESESRDRKKG
jgi:hypothetical protein